MLKYLLLFCIACLGYKANAQTDSLSKEDKRLLDSMFKNDEFINMMKKDKNYLDISIGIGNGAFSEHNNAANATGVDKQLIYTPTVTYRLKNGFSLGVSPFITAATNGGLELYQTGINAGYDYFGKAIHAGGAYSWYISDQNKYNSKSLYQHDFSAYGKMAKGLFQPGVTLGYVTGKYKELNFISIQDTVHLPFPLPNGRDTIIKRTLKDSTNNKTSYFSVAATVGHDFYFYNVFTKNDELDFTPTLMLNMGSDRLTQTHTNKVFNRPVLSKRKKREYNNQFKIQSIAASFNFTYMVKKFFIEPVIYFDYYLPETTENRFSAVFSVNAGFSF